MHLVSDAGAGASQKWKQQPIGGEISPALWKREFTESPHKSAQNFLECVEATHVSWLMDSGMFNKKSMLDEARVARALKKTSRMGYELFVSQVSVEGTSLKVKIENRGVAPFYFNWPVEIQASENAPIIAPWKISEILPGEPVEWSVNIENTGESVRMRVRNPMDGGKALRFANSEIDGDWLILK